MMWQPGPAHDDAVFRACEKERNLKESLRNEYPSYLKGIVEMGDKTKGWIYFKAFLRSMNLFNYGEIILMNKKPLII